MNHPKLLRFVFFLASTILLTGMNAQNSWGLQVEEINYTGLKKTKTSYLQRFIESTVGTELDLTQLAKDVQQLKNLNSVANATYQLDTLAGKLKLTFDIEEAITFFPIINFGGVRGNFWYQLGFTDANWLGLGHQLTAFYQNNDRRDNFSIYYRHPYINGTEWGISGSLLKWASVEPLYFSDQTVFYDYDNYSVGATGIYEIGRQHWLEFGGTFFIEEYRKNERHAEVATPGPDALRQSKLLAKLIHQYNRVNYHFFYQSGFDNTANAQLVYNFYDNTWFEILLNDTRYFKRVGKKGNLAARLRLGISTNNDTPFAPFVLDSYVNIRGSGNRIDRGTAAIILNLEYRHTFFDRRRFAGQFVAFSDMGTWRNPGGSFSDLLEDDNFRHFMGGGIRVIYKKAYNAIFRLDYGVDIHNLNQRGFVLGIGQYF